MSDRSIVATWLVAGLIVLAIIAVITLGVHLAQLEGTVRLVECVDAGGSWIDYHQICIAESGEQR